MVSLEGLEQALALVAERAGPAVVAVRGRGRGTGVIVGSGRVVTNAHNVVGARIDVRLPGGRGAEAEVAGVDLDSDLAVLSLDTGDGPAVAWDGEERLGLGRAVYALGATGGGVRVTWGTVAAADRSFRGPRGRLITGAVEHTAPLARGSSGGPLVDADGALLAINTHRLGEGFYLAVPAGAALRQRVELLGRGEQPRRVRLGVALAPSSVARHLRAAVGLPEREGLLVRAVEDGGPAARAGVRQGDLLVEAAGRPLATLDDVFGVLDTADAGPTLGLRLVRGSDEHEVTVEFEDPGGAP